jgi:hypothetical protein
MGLREAKAWPDGEWSLAPVPILEIVADCDKALSSDTRKD